MGEEQPVLLSPDPLNAKELLIAGTFRYADAASRPLLC